MKTRLFVFLVVVNTVTISCSSVPNKRIIGAVEMVQVNGLEYLARIDTGADITSINAYDITVENADADVNANVGKLLHFTTANEKGDSKSVTVPIAKVNSIRSAFGTESRYVVLLPIIWRDYVKTVEVNLRDRSKMQFALLIGRNWLKNDFIVDVSEEVQKLREKMNILKDYYPKF
jgi:hypothetical protein